MFIRNGYKDVTGVYFSLKIPGNRGWPDGRVPVSREFVDFNMRKGYKKKKIYTPGGQTGKERKSGKWKRRIHLVSSLEERERNAA